MTYRITIELSDNSNNLSQTEWMKYIAAVRQVAWWAGIHFAGGTQVDPSWKNYYFIIECDKAEKEPLLQKLRAIRKTFRAELAVTVGTPEFM